MAIVLCICGERIEGSDDELFGLFRAHNAAAHADLELSDEKLHEILAGWSVGDRWDGSRRAVTGPVEVKPLGLDTLQDFLRFFDRRAFMDNPFWFGCYCAEPHHAEPKDQSPAENREEKVGLIRAGVAKGFLAYVDGEPVGWCNAAPRSTVPDVLNRVLAGTDPDPDEPVGAIPCFTVAAPWRGSGVGRALLAAACEGLREQGLPVAEAYPRKGGGSEAESFRGPLAMYESAGFSRHGESQHYLVVRKRL